MNINNLKELVKDCVYAEDGIVCMNNDYYCNILKEIERLNKFVRAFSDFIDDEEYWTQLGNNGEEKKIPEKISVWYEFNGTYDKELTKLMLDELKDKYNEIIDYLKSKGE